MNPVFIIRNIQVSRHQAVQKNKSLWQIFGSFFFKLPSQKSVTSDNASEASNPPNVSKIFVS